MFMLHNLKVEIISAFAKMYKKKKHIFIKNVFSHLCDGNIVKDLVNIYRELWDDAVHIIIEFIL